MPSDSESLAGDLIGAVEILAEVLEARRVRYAILGGLATMVRGRPRFTQDVDVLLHVPQLVLPGLLDELVERGFTIDRESVVRQYAHEHMAVFHYGVVRIDWLKPVLPLYVHALESASSFPWTEGHFVRVVSPEGLIVTKLVSFRPQDQEDIRALLAANRDDIDVGTIRREWAAVALGEDSRTSWLEAELAALFPGR